MKQPVILNSKGEPIVLNAKEQRIAEVNQKIVNSLGYEINITTLTTIIKKVTEQKFFEIAPADYMPVRVGEGSWSSNLITYRSFQIADDFDSGIINTGANSAKLAQADAGVDSVSVKVLNWAKEIGWSIFDLELAAKSGNWDLVTAKEKSRKRNWDLGIQKTAFLGIEGDSSAKGLYNLSGVTDNLTAITAPIKGLSAANLNTLLGALVEAYRNNCVRTAYPTHFIIPESDYNGLASLTDAAFPIKTKLQVLEEAFQLVCRNKNFKILPCAYGDAAYNSTVINKQRYILLNYDEESVRMDIPVDYTNTLANSVNNFSFQNVGYGQFTGVGIYRPLEVLYFSY
jgi:hypothetical protein